MLTHAFYMKLALDEAWKYQFLTYPNPAVGALLLGSHSEILAISAHKQAGFAHAEVNAFCEAYVSLTKDEKILELTASSDIHEYLKKHHNNIFHDTTLYTTLAPCHHTGKTPSCSSLLIALGVKTVVVGSLDPHSIGGIQALEDIGIQVELSIQKQACDDLLEPFLAWKEKRPFNFFKVAMHANGTVDGGLVSNLASRCHVHELRSKVDALMIGGNTVRLDRPTLDTRLIKEGKNPNIMIYSSSQEFDVSIPLFGIKNRTVTISSDKQKLLGSCFTMIEGGKQSFESLKDDLDWILLYVSGTMAAGITLQSEFHAKIMHVMPLEDNLLIWMKKIKG